MTQYRTTEPDTPPLDAAESPEPAGPLDVFTDLPAFAAIPRWLEEAPISDRAYRLFGVLTRYAYMRDGARPSLDTLADTLRTSRPTIKKALRELDAVGAITRTPRYAENGRQLPSAITLHYRSRALEPAADTSDGGTDGRPDPSPTCGQPVPGEGVTGEPLPPSPVDNHPSTQDVGGKAHDPGVTHDPGRGSHTTPERDLPREIQPPSARETVHSLEPGAAGEGGRVSDEQVRGVAELLTAKLPDGTPPLRGATGARALADLLRDLMAAGWRPSELDAAVDPAGLTTVRHPARWLASKLEPLREVTAPAAAAEARAARTAAQLEQLTTAAGGRCPDTVRAGVLAALAGPPEGPEDLAGPTDPEQDTGPE